MIAGLSNNYAIICYHPLMSGVQEPCGEAAVCVQLPGGHVQHEARGPGQLDTLQVSYLQMCRLYYTLHL